MEYISSRYLFAALFSLFVLASCSSSENTIVIEDAPVSSGSADTTQQQQTEPMGPFKQLTIGENQVIQSLDPLFVSTDGGMRAIQLLYEGLVRYDENGEIIPAIASDWSTRAADKTYQFNLKNDLFYHDNSIFANGRGRRLVAADVKKAFERMAKAAVPDRAAQLFMNIKGFEPYYSEQHQVMMESERQLNSISGIRTPNDSTVVFSLVEADDQFLNKLASPYAVIYPQESVKEDSFKPVGTGPFTFSRQSSDSSYIFARFDNYRVAGQPKINRVDIVTSRNESSLLNAMNRGEIQLIPQLGPRQIEMAIDNNGQLVTALAPNHTLIGDKGTTTTFLRYNTGADLSKASVSNALATVDPNSLFSKIPDNFFEIVWSLSESESVSKPDSLASTYSDNSYVHNFYSQLTNKLAANNIVFDVSETRVRNRNTAIYAENSLSLHDVQKSTTPGNTLITLEFQSLGIAHNDLENLQFNAPHWWINLRDVTLPSTNSR